MSDNKSIIEDHRLMLEDMEQVSTAIEKELGRNHSTATKWRVIHEGFKSFTEEDILSIEVIMDKMEEEKEEVNNES